MNYKQSTKVYNYVKNKTHTQDHVNVYKCQKDIYI